jgi:hypothetical protein
VDFIVAQRADFEAGLRLSVATFLHGNGDMRTAQSWELML